MAQKVHIELLDDLDGTPATETVAFGLDGVEYEIDLGDGNAERLRSAVQPFLSAGRRVGGKRRSKVSAPKQRVSNGETITPPSEGPSLTVVREWARENGHEVSDRGRIPNRVMEAYATAVQ